jgi:hypothetical protein
MATVGDIRRFPDRHKLTAYLGGGFTKQFFDRPGSARPPVRRQPLSRSGHSVAHDSSDRR